MSTSRRTLVLLVAGIVILAYVAVSEVRIQMAHRAAEQALQRVETTEDWLNEHAFAIASNHEDIRQINQINNDQWDQLTDRALDDLDLGARVRELEAAIGRT